MRYKSVLYHSPSEIIRISQTLKREERLNLELLEKHIRLWPYAKSSSANWSSVLNIIKSRLVDITKLYFVPKKKNNIEYEINEYLQQTPVTEDDKNEILVALSFLEVIIDNTSGRSQVNFNDPLCSLAYCIEFEISYKALYLIRVIMHKQSRSIVHRYNKKMANLFLIMRPTEKNESYRISEFNFDILKDDIFALNKKLTNTSVNEIEYIKILKHYKEAADKKSFLSLKYTIADLFLFSRSPDINTNADLADIFDQSYGYAKTQNYLIKKSIYDFYIACIEKRYKIKNIYDGLRIRLYDGEFMTELRGIYTKDCPFIRTFLKFVTAFLTSKNDALNFITELGILGVFKSLLTLQPDDKNDLGIQTMKIYITKIIAMILDNRFLQLGQTLYENNLHEVFFSEVALCIEKIPRKDYTESVNDGSVFDFIEEHHFTTYLRYLLLCIDRFYYLLQTNGSDVDIVDLMESKFVDSLRSMLENNIYYSSEVLNHLFTITTNYINAHPLNIVIFEEKNILTSLLAVYNALPTSSANIIHLIDIVNGLSLNSTYLNLIIEKKIIRSICMTLVEKKYLECFTITDLASQIGISFEELIRHHPKYKREIFEECMFLLNTLLSFKTDDKDTRALIINDLFKQPETYNVSHFSKEPCNLIPYQEYTRNVLLFLDSLILVDTFSEDKINQIIMKIADLFAINSFYYDFDFDFIDLFNSLLGKTKGFEIQNSIYQCLIDKLSGILSKVDLKELENIQLLIHYLYQNEIRDESADLKEMPEIFYEYMQNYILINRILSAMVQIIDEQQPFKIDYILSKILQAMLIVEHIFASFTKCNQIIYFEYKPELYINESSVHTIKNGMSDFSNEIRYTMLIYKMRNNCTLLFFTHIRMLDQIKPLTLLIQYIFAILKFESTDDASALTIKLANNHLILCYIGNLISTKHACVMPDVINILFNYFEVFTDTYSQIPTHENADLKFYKLNDKVIDLRNTKLFCEKVAGVYFSSLYLLAEYELFSLTSNYAERLLQLLYKLINTVDCRPYSSEIQKILIFYIQDTYISEMSYKSYSDDTSQLLEHEKVYLSFLAHKPAIDNVFYNKRYYEYLLSINAYKVVNEMQRKSICGFFAVANNFKSIAQKTNTNNLDLSFYKSIFSNEILNMSDVENDKQDMLMTNLLIFCFIRFSYDFELEVFYKTQEQSENFIKKNYDKMDRILGAFSSDGADRKKLNVSYKPLQSSSHIDTEQNGENKDKSNQELFKFIYDEDAILRMCKEVCMFKNQERVLEDINFVIVVIKLIEHNLLSIAKKDLIEMINFEMLLTYVKQKQCDKTDMLFQLLIFYLVENDDFLTKVFRTIKKNKNVLDSLKNVLQYRNYRIAKRELRCNTDTIDCSHTITDEQHEIISLLKRNILAVDCSSVALSMFSHLVIYFPYFVNELKDKKFWHKYLNKLVKRDFENNDRLEQNRYSWAVNFVATIFLRTNNNPVKKIITDVIVKNLQQKNTKSINYMCKFMTGLLTAKIPLINEYGCESDCLIKLKPDAPSPDTSIQRSTTPVMRRRNSQPLTQNLNIEVNEILDELAGRIENSFQSRLQNVDEPMTTEEQSRLFSRLRKSPSEMSITSGSQVIDIFFERKLPDILLQANQTPETIPNILSLLELLSKLKNISESTDDSDSQLIEIHESSSTTESEIDEYEEYSNDDEDTEYDDEDDDEFIDEGNESEDNSTDYYLYESKSLPTILHRECRFTSLLDLWAHEFTSFMPKMIEIYFINDIIIDERLGDSNTNATPEVIPDALGPTNTENSQDETVRLPFVANSLVAEEEICTYQEDCQCIDCISQQSSESSVGEFDGITPDLDPSVLNDLPEDILHETISFYYDERRTVSTDYQPINTNFLLALNDRVRNIFEEYELRFRDDYRLNEKKEEHIIDLPEIKIRDKHPIIDPCHAESILRLVEHDVTQKTGLSLLNNLCSNANIRKLVMKEIVNNVKTSSADLLSEEKKPSAINSVYNNLKILGSLLKHQSDYIIYLDIHDINSIFNSAYSSIFSKVYQVLGDLLLLVTGYDTMKVIVQNTEDEKIEFTDCDKLISVERYLIENISNAGYCKEDLDQLIENSNFDRSILFYLPKSNTNFTYSQDFEIMNIMDSNISYFFAKYFDIKNLLTAIEETSNREILEYFENVMLCTENTFARQYIEFIFTKILNILGRVNLYSDYYDDLNMLYYYFNVIGQMRIRFERNKDASHDTSQPVPPKSYYFEECKKTYDNYRYLIENHTFWKYFFAFLQNRNDHIMSLLNVFECLCLLRKLRYDEDEYNRIIDGDDIEDETIEQSNNDHGGTDADNETDLDHQVKRLKTSSTCNSSPTQAFNQFFRICVLKYSSFFNRIFEGNINTISKTCDILLHYNVLEFHNKRRYLRHVFKKHGISTLYLNIDRKNLVEDSYTQIMSKSGKDLRVSKLHVKFLQEEGVDMGGLSREFYTLLSNELVNPDYYLFTRNQDGRTYSINKSSHVNAEHLLFFRFVGRIIAKGIIDNNLTDIHFTAPFYKQILGKKLSFADLEQVDPSFYRSLKWMQNNSIEGFMDCYFSSNYDEFGITKTYDLIENGRNIKVDDSNKHQYVELIANFHMTKNCEKQMLSFKHGFYEVMERKYVKAFNEKELELLISGLPEIDVDDWRNNTEYHGYKSSSLEIQWFWRCVRGMNNEDRARLLQFVTGTSKLPIEGFKALQGTNGRQKFQIHAGNKGLPCAHTCFNQLDLPKYNSYEELVTNLHYAIKECSTGFGFA